MRTSYSTNLFGILILVILSLFAFGCSSDDTITNDDHSGGGLSGSGSTVTFQLTAPGGSLLNGRMARASLWLHWNDSLPMTYGDAIISGGTATIPLDSIADGTYVVLVSIDSTGDGFVEDNPIEVGGYLFGALNVVVTDDRTIAITEDYWQHLREGMMIFAIDGISAGHNGQVIGAGLFNDGEGVISEQMSQTLAGGAGLIWNNSIIIALNPSIGMQTATAVAAVPYGSYDVVTIVDVDGTLDDWNGEGSNPISEGDLVDYADVTIDEAHPADQVHRITVSLETLNIIALNFTAEVPTIANGKPLYVHVLGEFGTEPIAVIEGSISGGVATAEAAIWTPGSYHLAAIVDMDENGVDQSPNATDLAWGAMDINLTVDQAITLPDSVWQECTQGSQLFLVNNVPAGNNGKLVALGVYEDGEMPLNMYTSPQFAGLAYVYNNSAMVIANATHLNGNPSNLLPNGEYDVWAVVDVDGTIANYNESTFVRFTPGDHYITYSWTRNTEDLEALDPLALPTDFATTRGITGTVSCPSYTSGDIYVYLFHENPLSGSPTDPVTQTTLADPGDYALPCLANDSVYVIGFWDADQSGEDGGPTSGDLIGAYGVSQNESTDGMVKVHATQLEAGNIDFLLWLDSGGVGAPGRIGW